MICGAGKLQLLTIIDHLFHPRLPVKIRKMKKLHVISCIVFADGAVWLPFKERMKKLHTSCTVFRWGLYGLFLRKHEEVTCQLFSPSNGGLYGFLLKARMKKLPCQSCAVFSNGDCTVFSMIKEMCACGGCKS